jgi:hypothetical protein
MPELVTSSLHLPAPPPLPPPTPAPRSTITLPPNGATARGNLEVIANAADNVRVTKVELKVSNASNSVNSIKAMTVTITPSVAWRTSWDTTSVPNGSYVLRSVVYDVKGKSVSSKPVTVHVAN